MTLLPYALAAGAGVATLCGGLLARRLDRRIAVLFGLTSGCVVGLSLLDLLPEALDHGVPRFGMSTVTGMMVAGFGLYLLLHRCMVGALAGQASLLIHSVMDGLGIGMAFQLSEGTGWLVAMAVLGHDMADGANMVGLTTVGRDRCNHDVEKGERRVLSWLGANALAPLVGVVVGQTVPVQEGDFALLLALFAGGFLYIGAAELLPRSRSGGLPSGLASACGLAFMVIIMTLTR